MLGTGSRSPFELSQLDEERLAGRLRTAVRRARRSGAETLAAISLALPDDVDPTAVACASRRPGEHWFAFEQPDRGHAALAGLGEAVRIEAAGSERFASVAERWRALSASAVGDPADGAGRRRPGRRRRLRLRARRRRGAALAGLRAGLAGRPGGRAAAQRARRRSVVRLTLAALVSPDDMPEELLERLRARLGELREQPLPLLDPAPAGRFQVASAMPPEHFEAAVARAVELIGAGELQKIVLAREVQVHAPRAYDPAAVLGVLREEFPRASSSASGAATRAGGREPELLVRREGHRVSTLALAGSTRRSADPAVDDHLGEQLLRSGQGPRGAGDRRPADRARAAPARGLGRGGPEPELVRIANIQHLATPIRAQLATPAGRTGARRADAPDPRRRRRAARAPRR